MTMMTKFKIELTPKAKSDLAMIKAYLSQFYTSTPKKFSKEFEKKLERLSFSPWHKKWDKDSNYRRVYVRDYVVLYIVDEDTNTVQIRRVLHSKRDFSRGEDIELMEERAEYRPAPKYNHIYGPMRSRRLGNSQRDRAL